MNKKIKEINSFSAIEKIKKGAIPIDIRELEEVEDIAFKINEIRLMPQSNFTNNYYTLPKNTELIICCHSGRRSKEIVRFLLEKDFKLVYSLAGGIEDWIKNGFPVTFDNSISKKRKPEDLISQQSFLHNNEQNLQFANKHYL